MLEGGQEAASIEEESLSKTLSKTGVLENRMGLRERDSMAGRESSV